MQPEAPASSGGPPRPRSSRGALSRYYFTPVNGGLRLRPAWRRVVATAVILGIGCYIGAAGLHYVFLRHARGIAGVRFVDALLPHRRPLIRIAQGNHAIGIGMSLARAGQFREAIAYLGAGVRNAPGNRDGRLLYAQVLAGAAGHDDLARRTLLDGLAFHRDDPAYLLRTFTFLLDRQEDAAVVALARELLAIRPASLERTRVAALAAATASFHRGSYDQAEDFLRDAPMVANSVEGRLLGIRIEWERGYRELAVWRLRMLSDEMPRDASVHHELAQQLRQLGLTDEARRRAVLRQISQPTLAGPRIELLRAYHESKDAHAVAREADALLRDFASDQPALLAMADFAAHAGNTGLSAKLLHHAQSRGFPADAHGLLHIEALLTAREFKMAVEALNRLGRERGEWALNHAALIETLKAVAYLGLGETDRARPAIAQFLDGPALRADHLLAVARRFVELDAVEDARRILARAVALEPLNQAALSRLIELELLLDDTAELPAHLLRFVAMRKPSPDILRVARHKLGSDLFLFSPARAAALDAVRAALDASPALARRH